MRVKEHKETEEKCKHEQERRVKGEQEQQQREEEELRSKQAAERQQKEDGEGGEMSYKGRRKKQKPDSRRRMEISAELRQIGRAHV